MAYNTIQSTIDWAKPFVRNYPLTGGTNSEPAITSANIVSQTIMNAPFTWEWNRVSVSGNLVSGTNGAQFSLADFGFMEKMSARDSGNVITDVATVRGVLALGSLDTASFGLPTSVATQTDDGAGNILFRFQPTADATYALDLLYQKAAPVISALTGAGGTWSPIPNKYSMIYSWGFLGMMYLFLDDSRWMSAIPRFLSSLVGISQGLSMQQKSIFLGDWLQSHLSSAQIELLTKQGNAAGEAPMLGIGGR